MTDEKAVPKRRGRPPKKAIQEKKKPGKVGRPAGDADAIREYTGGKAAVNITITGVGGDTTIIGEQEDALDGDFVNLNPGANENE